VGRVGLPLLICLLGAAGLLAQQPATPPPAAATQQPSPAPPAAATQQPGPAPPAAATQQPGPAPAAAGLLSTSLKILILEGADAVNNIRVPMPTDLVVEVRDQNDRPVEGAMVSFQLPLMGPSGSFEGGVRNKDVITNVQGQAAASFTPNTEAGRLTIQVKAMIGGLAGMTSIMERNATETEHGGKKSWLGRHKRLVIIIAAATVGGVLAVVLTRGSGSSSTSSATTTVTITPGVPTVGGP
jgi:hypothetical protein